VTHDTGGYRYVLTREPGGEGRGTVAFIGLNPSTADEHRDDPTTRRCSGFARSWGYARLVLVNLFALRATSPRDLAASSCDIVGPGNDAAIADALASDLVVCAWGASIPRSHATRPDEVLALVREPYCLGLTSHGRPRHPLYVPSAASPVRLPRATASPRRRGRSRP
jgi:hypothetical protein